MSREETKQEIIREGIAYWIQDEADNGYLRHWDDMVELLHLEQQWDYFLHIADLIMADESKRGVVIKVDTDLQVLFTDEDKNIISQTKSEWAVVESLIGDE